MSEEKFTETVERAIDNLKTINTISPDEFPAMDLYMDQLTTFMDSKLRSTLRSPSEDKVLTKTMINNYAKNDLLPPPVKKKYSKDHIILLIFIYYFKSVLSINDIQTLLEPLKERFQVSDPQFDLSDIYNTCFDLQKEDLDPLIEDIKKKYERSLSTFEDNGLSEDEKKKMQMFSFIIQMLYDVYVKKLLMEKILDNMMKENEKESGKKQKSDKKNKTKE